MGIMAVGGRVGNPWLAQMPLDLFALQLKIIQEKKPPKDVIDNFLKGLDEETPKNIGAIIRSLWDYQESEKLSEERKNAALGLYRKIWDKNKEFVLETVIEGLEENHLQVEEQALSYFHALISDFSPIQIQKLAAIASKKLLLLDHCRTAVLLFSALLFHKKKEVADAAFIAAKQAVRSRDMTVIIEGFRLLRLFEEKETEIATNEFLNRLEKATPKNVDIVVRSLWNCQEGRKFSAEEKRIAAALYDKIWDRNKNLVLQAIIGGLEGNDLEVEKQALSYCDQLISHFNSIQIQKLIEIASKKLQLHHHSRTASQLFSTLIFHVQEKAAQAAFVAAIRALQSRDRVVVAEAFCLLRLLVADQWMHREIAAFGEKTFPKANSFVQEQILSLFKLLIESGYDQKQISSEIRSRLQGKSAEAYFDILSNPLEGGTYDS